MSLIHEALKKAELEKKPGEEKSPGYHPIIPDKESPLKNTTLILVAFLAAAIGILIYMRFIRKTVSDIIPKPIAALPGEEQMRQQSPARLKEKALELYQANQFEDSLKIWEQLTFVLPTDAEVYNNLGLLRKKTGKKKEAYDAYYQALALNKDYPEALNNVGVLTLSDGDSTKAKGLFEKAISLKEDYADGHFNLALILEQEGNWKEARVHYQHFLNFSLLLDEELKKKIQDKLTALEQQ